MPRKAIVILVGLIASATIGVSVAYGSFASQQQRLLGRGCNLAASRIERMMSEAATKQVVTIQTQVRLLNRGELAADIAFNPSGSTINVAGDRTAGGTLGVACGYSVIGSGFRQGQGGEGVGIPKRHVVAVVRKKIAAAGRYTLTLTLNQRGRKILANLGAAERAYRKHHPHGHHPPTITWGVGIHFDTTY